MDKIDIIAKRIANEEKLTRIAKKLVAGIHDDIKIEKHMAKGKSYWGDNGLYQDKYEELRETDALSSWPRTYYRFYNDGDIPKVTLPKLGRPSNYDDRTKIAQALEYWADEKILNDWKRMGWIQEWNERSSKRCKMGSNLSTWKTYSLRIRTPKDSPRNNSRRKSGGWWNWF